ncbi:MAG: hypothetical protein IKQ14_00060 [Candidatus Methanomethylophilaceae archaeon]|nr:hypothetical protein [Candidatus Methanomethylophilaceae archaeon]
MNPSSAALLGNIDERASNDDDIPGMSKYTKLCIIVAVALILCIATAIVINSID